MTATETASTDYPSIEVAGHLLHVCENAGEWEVWINCEDMDFTGVCVGTGPTRQAALSETVAALEAILARLQGPPW